jgi:hypothetical protein
VTSALRTLSGAFGGEGDGQPAGRGHPGQVTGGATAALAGGTALPGADGDPSDGLAGDPAVPGDLPGHGDLTRAEQAVAEQAARTREELAHVEDEVAAVQAEAQRFSPS